MKLFKHDLCMIILLKDIPTFLRTFPGSLRQSPDSAYNTGTASRVYRSEKKGDLKVPSCSSARNSLGLHRQPFFASCTLGAIGQRLVV